MTAHWCLVIPVKGTLNAKTRLGAAFGESIRSDLAFAFARDTIAAALATPGVDRVIVVTGRTDAAGWPPDARVTVIPEGEPRGLNAAIRVGLDVALEGSHDRAVGVLLGDLPALRPDDLEEALRAAAGHPLAVVPDAEGTGTTLVTALPGTDLMPAFGPGSAVAHRAVGHVELALRAGSTLRDDIDTPEALARAIATGVGPATRRCLERAATEGASH